MRGALPIIMPMSTSNNKHGTCNFLFKNIENTYPKGRALMQMYRVVPQMKRRNFYHVNALYKMLVLRTASTICDEYFLHYRFIVMQSGYFFKYNIFISTN